MNKQNLVETVSINARIPRRTAMLIVDSVFNTIVNCVAEGIAVDIDGFGIFTIGARTINGADVARKRAVVTFIASSDLRTALR
ncbi:HU family DNA-binding protein [Caballeronia pedi]|uniref:HU family DNA-binding protein n=1 Tax=Caballeronia pedi TaxID=1777141 RepID=UPI000B352A42